MTKDDKLVSGTCVQCARIEPTQSEAKRALRVSSESSAEFVSGCCSVERTASSPIGTVAPSASLVSGRIQDAKPPENELGSTQIGSSEQNAQGTTPNVEQHTRLQTAALHERPNYQQQAQYFYQAALAPVFPAHQAQFLPITGNGYYQLAAQSFGYPAGNQLAWSGHQVTGAYPAPFVASTPLVGHQTQLCPPTEAIINQQSQMVSHLHYAQHHNQHPAVAAALRPALYTAQQASPYQSLLYSCCEPHQQQNYHHFQVATDQARQASVKTKGDDAQEAEAATRQLAMANKSGHNQNRVANDQREHNEKTTTSVSHHDRPSTTSAAVGRCSGDNDDDDDDQLQRAARDNERHGHAQQAGAIVHPEKISYHSGSSQLEHESRSDGCHFVDNRQAQQRQPTGCQNRTAAPAMEANPCRADVCSSSLSPSGEPIGPKAKSDANSNPLDLRTKQDSEEEDGRRTRGWCRHSSGPKSATESERTTTKPKTSARVSAQEEKLTGTTRNSSPLVGNETSCTTSEQEVQEKKVTLETKETGVVEMRTSNERGLSNIELESKRVDVLSDLATTDCHRPGNFRHYDRRQARASPKHQQLQQVNQISINGTTFYNVPLGAINRIEPNNFQQQHQNHHHHHHHHHQSYNSQPLLTYGLYQGLNSSEALYYQPAAYSISYPYFLSHQPAMTFGSQQATQLLPTSAPEVSQAFHQSAATNIASNGMHQQQQHPMNSYHPSHVAIQSFNQNGEVLGQASGLNLSFSQLKLGYNLIPLLPIDASPTRIRQAYGMDKVWQDEFELLFCKFVSSVVWTLVEVEQVPNIRNTSRILNYKGRFVVRASCSSSSGDSSEKSFMVSASRGSSSSTLNTPSCSSDTDEQPAECRSEPHFGSNNSSASVSELEEVEHEGGVRNGLEAEVEEDDEEEDDDDDEEDEECGDDDECTSQVGAEENAAESDQGQSDCDSGAVLDSSTSGASETTSTQFNTSRADGRTPTPLGSTSLRSDCNNNHSTLSQSQNDSDPVSLASAAQERKFPLRFKMFIDSAKVRFCCDNCGHGWTSMKGRVVFWYELFELIDDGDEISNLIGYCAYKLFGQQCDVCKVENRFERPMWYPEEVSKVLANLYNKIGQIYFGFKMPTIDKQRRAGKPKTSHNSLLCQACQDGVCTDRK